MFAFSLKNRGNDISVSLYISILCGLQQFLIQIFGGYLGNRYLCSGKLIVLMAVMYFGLGEVPACEASLFGVNMVVRFSGANIASHVLWGAFFFMVLSTIGAIS